MYVCVSVVRGTPALLAVPSASDGLKVLSAKRVYGCKEAEFCP